MPKYIPKAGRRSHRDRQQDNRPKRKRFLIICEGKETEPNYFEGFRPDFHILADVKPIGTGTDTIRLVRKAVEVRAKWQSEDVSDECWCMFDKDDFPIRHFNDAVRMAEKEGFKVAYSNQSFELWYVLHFQDLDSALPRSQYNGLLTRHLGEPYQKDAGSSNKMYSLLRSKMDFAIKRAERLEKQHHGKTPSASDPCTTVHLLVKSLLKESESIG